MSPFLRRHPLGRLLHQCLVWTLILAMTDANAQTLTGSHLLHGAQLLLASSGREFQNFSPSPIRHGNRPNAPSTSAVTPGKAPWVASPSFLANLTLPSMASSPRTVPSRTLEVPSARPDLGASQILRLAQASTTFDPDPSDPACFDAVARPKPGKVQIDWSPVPGAERYEIHRGSDTEPVVFQKVGDAASNLSTFLDASVPNEQTYLYFVRAIGGGASCDSTVASAHPTTRRGTFNYPPVIYSRPITQGLVGVPYRYHLRASDPYPGDPVRYEVVEGPEGMDIDPTTGWVEWQAVVGTHPVTLLADDDRGGTDLQSFVLQVLQPNRPPIADPGLNRVVHVTTLVTLDGSQSLDPDNDPLSFVWSLVDQPAGGTAVLTDPESPQPSLVPNQIGTYRLQLVVHDGKVPSEPAWVEVVAGNTPPVAHAGPAANVPLNATVRLDGSRSSDADGDPITYRWSILSRPTGSTASLLGETLVQPSFTADRRGEFVLELVVDDGFESSLPSQVTITVSNTAPLANAGTDTTVPLNATVTLDGSGSSDVDGDPLQYRWSLVSQPPGSNARLVGETSVRPTFIAGRRGEFIAELIVHDGTDDSAPDRVTISTINSIPVAHAGPDQTAPVLTTVTLDGTLSSDPDNDPLTYRWSVVSQPIGSAIALSDATAGQPTFQILVPGNYLFELIVHDGYADSVADSVTISTVNSRPVAKAGDDLEVRAGTLVRLNGTGSSDVDKDPLTYAWSMLSTPDPNLPVAFDDPTSPTPTFLATQVGVHVVQLIVQDGATNSEPDTLTVTVVPALVAVPDVVGMPQAQAESTLVNATLAVGAIATAYHSTVPAGRVISQNPLAGTLVEPATAVALVVSLGPPLVAVPDVVGELQADAEQRITTATLTVGGITRAFHPTVPLGRVLGQDPVGGTLVLPATSVALVVSLGPEVLCAFAPGEFAQWQTTVAPVPEGKTLGSVAPASSPECALILREGDSFEVTAQRTFTLPAEPGMLVITYETPSFDTTATGAMRDAFEVALVDGAGRPLTTTIQGNSGLPPVAGGIPAPLPPSPDALFNHTEGLPPFVAAGAAYVPGPTNTLAIDLRSLAPGSNARLILRLVNNDEDDQTGVRIRDVRWDVFKNQLNLGGSPDRALSTLLGQSAQAGVASSEESRAVNGTTSGCDPAITGASRPGPVPKIVVGAPSPSSFGTIKVFQDRNEFLVTTQAEDATGPLPDLGLIPGGAAGMVTLGQVTLTISSPSSELYVGSQGTSLPDWTARNPGPDIAISDIENLNIALGAPVYSLGFDFVEPEFDEGYGPFIDSTFQVQLKRGGTLVDTFEFNVPNDTPTFVGVWSRYPFDRVEIRETTGGIDDEFFGRVYAGLASPPAASTPHGPTLAITAPADQLTTPIGTTILSGYALAQTSVGAVSSRSLVGATYFGEDVSAWSYGGLNAVPRPVIIKNTEASARAFRSRLPGVQSHTFEDHGNGDQPTDILFGTNVARLSGGREILTIPDHASTFNGIFPVSGTNVLILKADRINFFNLDFPTPQAAFGFYGNDVGEPLGLGLGIVSASGARTEIDVPITKPQGSGGSFFFGIVSPLNHFTRIEFQAQGTTEDWFGFDDFTIGTADQVAPTTVANRIVRVTVNGSLVEALDQGGNFFFRIQIQPGRSVFEVVATDAFDQSTTNTIEVFGTTCIENFASLGEVSTALAPEYGRTSFNDSTEVLYSELSLRNSGLEAVGTPLYVGVTRISGAGVELLAPDGVTADGVPFYDFSAAVSGNSLPPGAATAARTLAFSNPNRTQFSYELVILGRRNQPPTITSLPTVTAMANRAYSYDADATDPDSDPLTYTLVTGPSGLAIAPSNGVLTWSPSDSDLGTHDITLRVEDGRGGPTEQRYLLSVSAPPANRPPYFTSTPVTTAAFPPPDCRPLAGIISWWDMDSVVNSGFADIVGNNQASSAVGLIQSQGLVNMALTFDGTAFLTASDSDLYAFGTNSFSIELWANWGRLGGGTVERPGDVLVANDEQSGVYRKWFLALGGGFLYFHINSPDYGPQFFPLVPFSPVPGQWYHIGLTRSGPTYRLYIDGIERGVAINEDAIDNPNAPLTIGWGEMDSGAFRGMLDELTIYNRDLSAKEVSAIYAAGAQGKCRPRNYQSSQAFYAYDAAAIDPDLDGVAYTIIGGPDGMSIDSQTGKVSWEPGIDQIGQHQVSLAASDGNGGSAIQSFVVTIQGAAGNRDPAIVSDPITSVVQDQSYRYPVRAMDPDGDSLEFALTRAPSGMGIDKSTGLIQWDPPADFFVRGLRVMDDMDFSAGSWDIRSKVDVNTSSSIAIRDRATGGNEGRFLEIDFGMGRANILGKGPEAWVFVSPQGMAHDPSSQGAVRFIDYSEDRRSIIRPKFAPFGQQGGLAILQGGKVYAHVVATGDKSTWERFAFTNLTELDFVFLDYDENGLNRGRNANGQGGRNRPDFSASGALMEFGIVRAMNSSPWADNGYRVVEGVDNWKVEVFANLLEEIGLLVSDGNGGLAQQEYSISPSRAGAIVGAVFSDMNRDGVWNRAEDLWVGRNRYLLGSGAKSGVLSNFGSEVMAVGPDGLIYEVDTFGRRLLRYNAETMRLVDVALEDDGLYWAYSLVFGKDNDVFVMDLLNSRVLRYSLASKNLIGVVGQGSGLQGAWGGAVGGNGNLYVASHNNSRIYEYARGTGAVVKWWAAPGTPTGVTFGPDGMLYAGTFQNDNVLRFDPARGVLLNQFIPSGRGGLDVAVWLGFSSGGSLFVRSAVNDRTLEFDGHTGQYLRVLDSVTGNIGFVTGNSSEPGISSATVFVDLNRNGRRDSNEAFSLTDENGQYTITNLGDGVHYLRQDMSHGWRRSDLSTHEHRVQVAAGATVWGINFGNVEVGDSMTPSAPQFATTPVTVGEVGQNYRYDSEAVDLDDDALAYELILGPSGMGVERDVGTVFWRPERAQVGAHDVVLRVQDGRGGVDLQAWQIQVVGGNTAPVITSAAPLQGVADIPYFYEVRAQDAENDEITLSLVSGPVGMSLVAEPPPAFLPPGLVWSAVALLRWTPSTTDVGDHPVVILATDARGAESFQSFTLSVVATAPNDLPVITSTPRRTVRAGAPYLYLLTASDPNSDPLEFRTVSVPSGMTLEGAGTALARELRWSPTAAQIGSHPITLEVVDGRGGVATQSFTLEVVTDAANGAPVITSLPRTAAVADRVYAYDATAEDPDADPVLWELVTGPAGMSMDARRGALRWSPTRDALGAQAVTIRATDPFGATGEQSFDLQVRAANQPPAIVSFPTTEASVGELFLYGVRATDGEGDPITFRIVTGPAGATLATIPGSAPGTATGNLLWTPTLGQAGFQTFIVEANDGNGGVASQNFVVLVTETPKNRPPAITSAPITAARPDQPYRYDVTASDPDGGTLSFQLVTGPAGMTLGSRLSASSMSLVWTPTSAQAGAHEVLVTAVDAQGAGARQRFQVNVRANQLPTIQSAPPTTVLAGTTYRYGVRAVDPDEDRLRYELAENPAGMTLDAYGQIVWPTAADASGTHAVKVLVSDPFGGLASQTFEVTVQPDTQKPTVKLQIVALLVDDEGRKVVEIGKPVQIRATAADNVGVQNFRLQAGTVELVVDANGQATAIFSRPAFVDVVATATDLAGNVGKDDETIRVVDLTAAGNPELTIESPADEDPLTQPTPVRIRIRSAAPLVEYVVEYATASDVDLSNIAGNNAAFTLLRRVTLPADTREVPSVEAAVFDPTMLLNDSYLIRVTITDINNRKRIEGVLVHVQGNLKFGEFRLEFTDLAVPVAGIPIQITRVYDSRLSKRSGDFGHGWSLGVRDAQIRETLRQGTFYPGTRVYLNAPDGRRIGFTVRPELVGAFGFTFVKARFTPDPGVYDTLEIIGDPTAILYQGLFLGGLGDENFNPSQYRLTTKDGTVYDYDQSAGLQQVVDSNANRLVLTRDGVFHYLSGQTTPDQSIPFTRDARGRITQITDPAGNTLRYTYDAAGDLRTFTDQEANVTQYGYDTARPHFLASIIDPLGRQALTVIYDATGRLESVVDASGNPIQQALDMDTNIGTLTDARGNQTFLHYDDQGNEIARIVPGISTNRFEFDANNNLLRGINARGGITNFTYDAQGNVTSITDPSGATTTMTYNNQGKPTKVVNALGQTLALQYNGAGQLLEVINNAGHRTAMTRDGQGRVTRLTDAAGNTTQFEYDGGCACGRPGKVINPDGSFRLYEYTSQGQTNRVVNELGAEARFDYDSTGRLLSTRDALGNETRFLYRGPLLTNIVDALGRSTRYEYDAQNRTNKIIDAEGGVVEFRYDANGNRTHVIDPVRNVTQFVYDADNRLIQQIDPLGHISRFAYDAAGNRIEAIDRNGRRRTFEYDAMNRMTHERWWEGSNLVRTLEYAFNALGVQTLASDPAARYEYQYDTLNRLTRVAQTQVPGQVDFTLAYAYTPLGQVASVTDNWGVSVGSEYNNRGLLARRTWQGPGIDPARVDFSYDPTGNRTRLDRFADLAGSNRIGFTTNGYNRAGIVTNITHLGPAAETLAQYDYTFDVANQIVQWTINGQPSVFGYDMTGQLTNAVHAAQPNEAYRYDANGNRIGAQPSGSYTVGGNNQILSDGTHIYGYDNEGNMTSRSNVVTGATTEYYFDHRNRLVEVLDRDGIGQLTQSVAFGYDANNRRLRKSVNGEVIRFVYNHDDSWADLDAAGAVTARYLHGVRIDELIARQRLSDGRGWYLTDHLGTVRDIGNASGETFVHVDYDCFGRALETHAHVSVGRFLFTGREWEPQLEVYFYRARYFSPGIGRFLSEDPIGFKGLDPNLYRYVSNVPLIGRDPSGNLTAIELGVLGSGLLGALLGLKSYVVCEITKANQTGISFQVSVGELIGAAAFGFLAGALGGLTVEFVAGLGLYTVPICAGIGFIKKKFG